MDQNWNVAFDDGFLKNHSDKRGGKEIQLNKSISWGDETLHIPAIYVCSKGLIMDLLIEVDSQKVWDHINKYDLINDEFLENCTREQKEQIENENPLRLDINAKPIVNGKTLKHKSSSGCSWIPNLPEDIEQPKEAIEILEHYGFDKEKAWTIKRLQFKWATLTKPKINRLELEVKQAAIPVTVGYFENEKVGDEIKVTSPDDGNEYSVTIKNIEKQSLKGLNFPDNGYDYPTEVTELTYTVSPEIETGKFRIFDCVEADAPKLKPKKDISPTAHGAASIGIIGGSDGPIAVITTSKKPEGLRSAVSSMHFDKDYPTKWRMVFYTKTREDISIKLI